MKPQRNIFNWFAMSIIFAVIFQFVPILPSVSAQGVNTLTPTATSATGGLKLTAASYAIQRPFGYPFPGASATFYTSIPVGSQADTIYASLVVTGNAADLYNDEQGDWPDMSMITYIQSMVPSGTLYIDQSWVGIPSVGFAMEDWLPSAALSSYGLPVTPAPYARTLSYTANLSTSLGSHMGVGKIWGSKMAVGTPYTLAVHIRYSVVGPGSPIPYDCSGTTLSPVAQAVKDKVGEQEYCGNAYNGLITLPPGQAAFDRFRVLADSAEYEVDFVTMGWDPDRDPNNVDSPGDYFIEGIKALYDRVKSNPGDHLVRVRILLGLKYYIKSPQDQRLLVLDDLADRGIPTQDTNWSVVVAFYRDGLMQSGKHSHVKMMIVDGKHVVASGYNMHYDYLDDNPEENQFPVHDMGVQISGPIAQSALEVFDGLWLGASGCQKGIFGLVICNTITDVPHDTAILTPTVTGNDVVFSLFRDDTDKTADNAIEAAINAGESNVNIIQNRFMNDDFWNPPQYARAILNALQKGDGQVSINLLVTGTGSGSDILDDLSVNTRGICKLKDQLAFEDPLALDQLQARFSSKSNPIHTKALSIDGTFIIVGSQNWDESAWENDNSLPFGDLAEYSLGVSSIAAANDFNNKFNEEFDPANGTHDFLCPDNIFSQLPLQQAISQAVPGSAIFLPGGVYTASVTIDKPLILIGAGANQTIIQPQGNEPAFRITSSDVVISNLNISRGDGYGIKLIDSSPSSLKNIQINRVVFENNAQGGVLVQGLIPGSPMNYSIENNTFIGGADGITINVLETQTNTSSVRNNIFSGQSVAPIHILSADDSHVEYSYNLFADCRADDCVTNWVQGNINTSSSTHDNLFDLDPLFSSSENGAYQLSTGSPAIDAGDPSLFHDLFYDGDNDGTVQIDIGAFEYAPVTNAAPVVNAGNDQTIDLGKSITVNAAYSDTDNSENHSARIDWGDGTIEDIPVNMNGPGAGEVAGQHTYNDVGNYTVKVCVVDIYGGVGCDTLSIEVLSTALYHFTGFFPPINNQPTLNTVKAGSAIPVKFSLDGYQGMNIFADGYPASGAVTCGSTTEDAIERAVTAGSSTLSYNADTDQYVYVWKTDKAWANTCRVLVVKLNDGSYYRASFKFK